MAKKKEKPERLAKYHCPDGLIHYAADTNFRVTLCEVTRSNWDYSRKVLEYRHKYVAKELRLNLTEVNPTCPGCLITALDDEAHRSWIMRAARLKVDKLKGDVLR